jgi:DNA repair protein RadC
MPKIVKEDQKSDLNKGHRQRVIDKLISGGIESFMDYQILEMLLFLVFKRCDTRTIAKTLLNKFGSIDRVLNAQENELMEVDGIGQSTYRAFKIISAVVSTCLRSRVVSRNVLDCFDETVKYCKFNMRHLSSEELRVIFLNSKKEVIDDKVVQCGTTNGVSVYPREIAKLCICKNAESIILVHNHPSGDPLPSPDDIVNSLRVREACDVLNIQIQDHLIIGDEECVSLKKLDLL